MTAWQDAGCALCRVKPHSQSRTSSWQLWEQQAGLGSAISLELSLRGARLVLTGRDPARLPELSEALPGSASTVLDLGHPDDGDRLVATVMTAFRRLDVLVNAAGVVAFGTLADTPGVVIEE